MLAAREALVEWRLPMPGEGFDYYRKTFALLEAQGSFAIPNATIASMTRCGDAHQWGTFTHGFAEPSTDAPSTDRITACVMTKDSASTLEACLRSIRPWCDALLVVDSGSTDATLAIAARFADTILRREWPGSYAAQRNFTLAHVDAEWMIMIDSDEVLQADFGTHLRRFLTTADRLEADVLWLPRLWAASSPGGRASRPPIAGHPARRVSLPFFHGHWYFHPDPQARVARMRKRPRYRGSLHEVLELSEDGRAVLLGAQELALVHLRIPATPLALRRAHVAQRNTVDRHGIHNRQLLADCEPNATIVRELAFAPDVLPHVIEGGFAP